MSLFRKIGFVLLLGIFMLPAFTLAAPGGSEVGPDGSFEIMSYREDFKVLGANTNARTYVVKVLNFGLSFLGLIAMIAVVYAGVLYVTAQGDDGQHEKAKKIILFAALGILVVLASFAFVNTIIQNAPLGTPDRSPTPGSTAGDFGAPPGAPGTGGSGGAGGASGGGSNPDATPQRATRTAPKGEYVTGESIELTIDKGHKLQEGGQVTWKLNGVEYQTGEERSVTLALSQPSEYEVTASYSDQEGTPIELAWKVTVVPSGGIQ